MDLSALSPPSLAWYREGRRIPIRGREIFVVERGDGPVVLLLHGFPTSCFDWRGAMDALGDEFLSVAFDFAGYGFSDKPEAFGYSLFDQADLVEDLAARLGIAEAHVVSHDMGTSVHCELLAREREGRLGFAIRASTFTNGSMLQWLAKITPFQKMLASNETLPQAMDLCERGLGGHVAALRALMGRPEVWSAEDGIAIEEQLRFADGHRRLPALAGYMRERYLHRDRWIGALKAAERRLQIVWGDADPIANVAMGRALRDMLPAAPYTELPGIGHFVVVEAAEAVAGKIAEFDPRFVPAAENGSSPPLQVQVR